MKTALLVRQSTGDSGTFGALTVFDGWECRTGELPWRENQDKISCIPEGRYICKWAWSDHFKKFLYRLQDVHGREGILLHSANFMGDKSKGMLCELEGCIALGMEAGRMNGQDAILKSGQAMEELYRRMLKEDFILTIKSNAEERSDNEHD